MRRSPSAKRGAGGQEKEAESASAKLRKEKKRRKRKVYPTLGYYVLYKPISNSWYGRFAMEIKLQTSFETKTGNHVSETVNRITNPYWASLVTSFLSRAINNKRDLTLIKGGG